MHLYENITIFNPTRSDEDIKASVEKTTEIITAAGGEVLKEDHWGRRKMAYELNRHDKGYYVLLLFKAPADTIARMEAAYKVNESIIKYMVLKLDKKQAEGTLKAIQEAANAQAAPAAEETAVATEETPAAEEAPAAEQTTEG